MKRLSTLDAEFLFIEDGIAHMHIGGVCVFGAPPPTFEEFTALIESRLHVLSRYRQRVRTVPLGLGRPVWDDDPHFSISYHLHHAAIPTPGDDALLERFVGRMMSQPLDRDRPLWEAWLVEGLADNRWAIVFKVHHCMVDGIAGVELLTALLSASPIAEIESPPPWEPQAEASSTAKVLDAWVGAVGDSLNWAAQFPRMLFNPRQGIRTASDTLGGLARLLGHLSRTPPLSIDGSIGPHRVWASSSVGLAAVKTIRQAFGGTINDVVLAAVTSAYRELLVLRGEEPHNAVVRSAVPVSTRTAAARGLSDNRVSTVLCELPVHIDDPVARLCSIHEQMKELKASHMADAGELITTLGNLAPPFALSTVTHLAMKVEHVRPQRVVNTITTNVPGPQFPLYCLGREMLEYRPYVPIMHGVRMSTAILSYNDRLFFGVTGDYKTMRDIGVVADAIVSAIIELRDLAISGS